MKKKDKNQKLSIGAKIAKLRNEFKMTQIELGAKVNISHKTISKWEHENGTPDYEALKAFSKVFGVRVTYFLEDTSARGIFKVIYTYIFEFLKKYYKVIILSLIIGFLGLYFISTYDSLEMYEIKSPSEDITFDSAYFIKSRSKIIFSINNINYNVKEENIISQKIKLYTIFENNKIVLYESDNLEDIIYRDFIDNKLTKASAKNIYRNLYIEIENLYENNTIKTKNYKLLVSMVIANNMMLFTDNLTVEVENDYIKDTIINENLLFNNNYKKIDDTNTYYKEFKDYTLYFDLSNYNTYYLIKNKNSKESFYYMYLYDYINYNKVNSNGIIVNKFAYNNETKNLECYVGNCDNYLEIYEKIIEVYNKAFS